MRKVDMLRVNISSPNGCQVKTEDCKEEAYWFIGKLSVCDKHMKEVCDACGWDYDKLVEEVMEGYR